MRYPLINFLYTTYSFTNTLPNIPFASFVISRISSDAFGVFASAAFIAKTIKVAVAVIICLPLIEFLIVFFVSQSNSSKYKIFSQCSFGCFIIFFACLFLDEKIFSNLQKAHRDLWLVQQLHELSRGICTGKIRKCKVTYRRNCRIYRAICVERGAVLFIF